MIPIFSGEHFEAMNVKNILQSNDIHVFIENEQMGTIKSWAVASGGFKPVIVKVNEADVEKAKELISFLAE